jgi:hypothetical protein
MTICELGVLSRIEAELLYSQCIHRFRLIYRQSLDCFGVTGAGLVQWAIGQAWGGPPWTWH